MNGKTSNIQSRFQYPTPTIIRGEPTHQGLKRLNTELRANASSIDSDLGGGDHGYLGLVLTAPEYTEVCPTAFTAPNFPARLTLPATATAVEAAIAREERQDQIREYRECSEVEKALLRHIATAIEDRYIESLKNEHTGLIDSDIPTVLQHLQTRYGTVQASEVKEEEDNVLKLDFNPSDPLVILFNPIEKLQKLATTAKMPYTEEQLINFGLTIIRNTRDFEKGLLEWRSTAIKTWPAFKTHFQDAQQELKDVRGPTMKQAGFHHANHLAQQIKAEMQTSQEELIHLLSSANTDSIVPSVTEASNNTGTSSLSTATTENPSANFTSSQNTSNDIVRLLQSLTTEMKKLVAVQTKQDPPKKKTPKKTPDDASFNRQTTHKYCWTHGGCGHTSADCKFPAPGHKVTATFESKMNGSKAFCS